jgi:DNA-binding GntR family transcriptional regulator
MSAAYWRTHNLPGTSTVRRGLGALVTDELVERHGDGYRVAEPFLAKWIVRNDV